MVGKLEMPYLPEFNVDKEICGFRETGVLKWICHLRPTHSPCEAPEDIHFTITVRSKVLRGALASLKVSLITFLFRQDLTG